MNIQAYQAPEIPEIGLGPEVIQGIGYPDDEPEDPYRKAFCLINSEED